MNIEIRFKNFRLKEGFLATIKDYGYEYNCNRNVITVSDPELEERDEIEEFEEEISAICTDVASSGLSGFVDYYCGDRDDREATEQLFFKNNIPYAYFAINRDEFILFSDEYEDFIRKAKE